MKSKDKLKVVKIGGKLIDDNARLKRILAAFARLEGNKILVHGGGSLASRISHSLGIKPRMIDGRRITSARDMEVVTMVYAGLVNKQIVAGLQKEGNNAIGLSGADGNSLVAHKRPVKEVDYGYVGDIEKVNAKMVKTLIELGLTPVFSAITHDAKGQLLNTNSDTVAAEIAMAMSEYLETELLYCFEKPGVLKDPEDERSVLPLLDYFLFEKGKKDGFIRQGMLPKLHTGFQALKKNVSAVKIGNETLLDEKTTLFTQLKL